MRARHIIIVSISILLFSFITAMAAEIPENIFGYYVKKQKACFTADNEKHYACEGVVFDTIAIKRCNAETAYVGIDLRFINGHSCGFYGIGRWENDKLIAKEKNHDGKLCKIELSFSEDTVSFKGEGEGCDPPGICSARGTLSREEVGFKKRKPKSH